MSWWSAESPPPELSPLWPPPPLTMLAKLKVEWVGQLVAPPPVDTGMDGGLVAEEGRRLGGVAEGLWDSGGSMSNSSGSRGVPYKPYL